MRIRVARGRRCAGPVGRNCFIAQSAVPGPLCLSSGASCSAERRNKAIAPYDPHFASFNFLNPLICKIAPSDRLRPPCGRARSRTGDRVPTCRLRRSGRRPAGRKRFKLAQLPAPTLHSSMRRARYAIDQNKIMCMLYTPCRAERSSRGSRPMVGGRSLKRAAMCNSSTRQSRAG